MTVSILLIYLLLSETVSEKVTCKNLSYNGSCFEVKKDEIKCCSYFNGVLCPNMQMCCPQGSTCSFGTSGPRCIYPNGNLMDAKFIQPCPESTSMVRTEIPSKTNVTAIICPDRRSTCLNDGTCCLMANKQWGCCAQPNAVCCNDGLHCCPQGTQCNAAKGTCDMTNDKSATALDLLLSDPFMWPELGFSQHTGLDTGMAYSGVMCEDKVHECPPKTTCCRGENGEFACCPFSEAVCCADKIHCCPHNTRCNDKKGRCESVSMPPALKPAKPEPSARPPLRDVQVCPDGSSRCLDSQTCCQLPDKTWGCCPVFEGVCCSDQHHCCPKGYKCDEKHKSCTRSPIVSTKSTMIICPNEQFRCKNGTTCCSLPNDEYACCPFPNAVCCSDQAHCCPENTTCDLEHNQCTSKGTGFPVDVPRKSHSRVSLSKVPTGKTACSGGLMQCPGGTCCKNAVGIDSCCPYPEAVCCEDGTHCCPKDKQCDASTGTCIEPDNKSSSSVPWLRKLPAQRAVEKQQTRPSVPPLSSVNRFCPDHKSKCDGNHTCCRLTDGRYGCCPYNFGVCCSDGRHCCPARTICTKDNTCERHSTLTVQRKVTKAYQMTSVVGKSSHQVQLRAEPGEVVRSIWCEACPNNGFCCPNAAGFINRKCCPATAGVCCADGEHCCPRGTRCVENGQCENDGVPAETYFASYLVAAKQADGKTPPFLSQIDEPALINHVFTSESRQATLNPLFLVESHYEKHKNRYTVCPDRERICGLDEQCCLSNEHGFVCSPKTAVCCSQLTNKYCPARHTCSADGLICTPAA